MSKRPQQPPVVEKSFESAEELDFAIAKLRRRVDEVKALAAERARWEDPKREALETRIRDTIREIYGANSPEYQRHQRHSIYHNPEPRRLVVTTAPRRTNHQPYFELGIPRTISMFEDELIAQLEEKKEDLSGRMLKAIGKQEEIYSIKRDLERRMPNSTQPAWESRGNKDSTKFGPPTVFIGHGGSLVWKDLRDFLRDRLGLACNEFNTVSVAGIPNAARLEEMMASSQFAFLVLTGEDEKADGTMVARANVIHEVGLFQGRLGFRRAIVLLEEGCAEFSNIAGLGQIRFPVSNVMAKSEEIRAVLEREGILRNGR